AYERVRSIFEAAAAKINGDPCVTWLGPGSVGHFVKMVHNGIEYGLVQLIAETYDLMKRSLGLNNDQIHEVYASWNSGEPNGYLVEISGHIFSKSDEKTGRRLIDKIIEYIANLPGKRRPTYCHAKQTWNLSKEQFNDELQSAFSALRNSLQRRGIHK